MLDCDIPREISSDHLKPALCVHPSRVAQSQYKKLRNADESEQLIRLYSDLY